MLLPHERGICDHYRTCCRKVGWASLVFTEGEPDSNGLDSEIASMAEEVHTEDNECHGHLLAGILPSVDAQDQFDGFF